MPRKLPNSLLALSLDPADACLPQVADDAGLQGRRDPDAVALLTGSRADKNYVALKTLLRNPAPITPKGWQARCRALRRIATALAGDNARLRLRLFTRGAYMRRRAASLQRALRAARTALIKARALGNPVCPAGDGDELNQQ